MLMILGIRCSSKDYYYVVLKGGRQQPEIVAYDHVAFPKGYTRAQELKWFFQEIDAIIEKHKIAAVSIKGPEGMARRDKSFVVRTENEAIVQLAASEKGIKLINKKVYCTIAKDLGLKGKAKYLKTDLDYSVFPEFNKMHDSLKDAILAAWSSFQ